MTIAQAIERFNFNPKNDGRLISYWREKYAPAMVLSLPDMTQAEKQKLTLLQEKIFLSHDELEVKFFDTFTSGYYLCMKGYI